MCNSERDIAVRDTAVLRKCAEKPNHLRQEVMRWGWGEKFRKCGLLMYFDQMGY